MKDLADVIVAFKSPQAVKPVLKICRKESDQVVINFISIDEHITIHSDDDGSLIRTHYYPDKPKSSWDELRVETARRRGNPHPERHGRYPINARLSKIDNAAGYHLVDRQVNLNLLNPSQHYINNIDKVMDAPDDKFMLTLYLSTKENPCSPKLERVATCLGDVCIEISKPITKL